MKFLFDIFPVLLFFVAFKLQGIYVATAVLDKTDLVFIDAVGAGYSRPG